MIQRNRNTKRFYRVNERISAPSLRVIQSDGKQIGVINRFEALKKAKENGLDLVEIAPLANPPVAKIIDFNKKKFDSLQLSGALAGSIREVHLTSSQYMWNPENVVLKKGEKSRLIVQTTDVQHGFEVEGLEIPDWDIDTIIKKGDTRIIEFTPDEAGAWDMVCTVYCGPGHNGMRGKFIVRE